MSARPSPPMKRSCCRVRHDSMIMPRRLSGESGADPDNLFSNDEAKGLRLFVGKARCMECHNGPQFTNFEFHNTGILSYPGDLPDRGRIDGIQEVRRNPSIALALTAMPNRDNAWSSPMPATA